MKGNMTVTEVRDKLLEAKVPTFKIELAFWHFDHSETNSPPAEEVTWEIYLSDDCTTFKGSTLEKAYEAFLESLTPKAKLPEAEEALKEVPAVATPPTT